MLSILLDSIEHPYKIYLCIQTIGSLQSYSLSLRIVGKV